MPARFMPLADVAETLSISAAQAYALVRRRELKAIQVGGRGQWRVEVDELEAYIQRMYAETERLASEPADQAGSDGGDDAPAGTARTRRGAASPAADEA
ncbi:helix-turn-helix domain-containing protein [Aquipuribacter hungaricus]|uniref:Helix-turn-helix domain-containing protein n=1 Tax=Aquipuribacter hungaricus TaxID=545624 RepID=A0ABV7WFQ7_9MICO